MHNRSPTWKYVFVTSAPHSAVGCPRFPDVDSVLLIVCFVCLFALFVVFKKSSTTLASIKKVEEFPLEDDTVGKHRATCMRT